MHLGIGGWTMKKIAIVADGWRRYINYAWIEGCRSYIAEHNLDVDLYVFNSFGNFNRDKKYNIGEYNITNLPDFSQFDGIILELTNIFNSKVKERIIQRVRESGVPAVSLIEELPDMYYTGIDNYAAMEMIVEHLVTVHGCRVLNFVGGPVDNAENQHRKQAYCDVLRCHGIPVEEKRIYCNDYEIETGENAFDYFKEKELIPDAFVCANDNIAVGICHRAKEEGYEVPRDFLLSGFDNFDKAAYYSPRITTVGFTKNIIAYKAIELLNQIWNGMLKDKTLYASAECVFQESCGCEAKNPPSRGQYVIDRIFEEARDEKVTNNLLEFKRHLIECESYEEIAECYAQYMSIMDCEGMCIVMNHDILQAEEFTTTDTNTKEEHLIIGYPERMDAVVAVCNGCVQKNIELKPGELLPQKEESGGGNLYLFSPLHFRDREIGYSVFYNCDYVVNNQFLFEILSTFQESLENLYNRVVLRRMNKELSMLYIRDSLTGLYNRMAYNRLAMPMFERCMQNHKPVMIMFVDVDRLKYINDSFGHDMGNLAIKTLATAIRQCCPSEAICMRYGGDEFVILADGYNADSANELVENITERIGRTSEALDTGFNISASIGYVIAEDEEQTLNDYINMADEQMYTIKKRKQMQRSDETTPTHRE